MPPAPAVIVDPSAPRWDALVGDAPFYVAVIDGAGRVRFLNRTPGGEPPASYLGRPVAELLPPTEAAALARLLADVARRGGARRVDVPARAGQQTIWLDVHLLPIRSGPEAGSVLAIGIDVTEGKQAALELRMSVNALHRVIEWREQLGADLHDGILQSLYGVGLGLEAARASLGTGGDGAERHLDRAVAQLRSLMAEIRRSLTDGPGAIPEPVGWDEALTGLLRGLEVAGGPAIELDLDRRAAGRMTAPVLREMVFIAREAVSNAVRHAGASRILVRLLDDGAAIRLEVEDDGRGFESAGPASGLGLLTMTRRARQIGATLTFQSLPGRGTLVRADLPLPDAG